jgi:hypothetical protein
VDSWAGDVSIDVGKPEQYREGRGLGSCGGPVRQAVQRACGRVDARVQVVRQGPYVLHVKLFAGI